MRYRRCRRHGLWETRLGPGCPTCRRQRKPGRDYNAHSRWARRVKARDGHRCTAVLPDGSRCPATESLAAHHLVPGSRAIEDGITLCGPHHGMVDKYAS